MQVQQIQQNNTRNQATNPKFKGIDGFFRYLATNQAVGANAVDLGFMVIPRTANDALRRGPDAGWETGRREVSGTANDSLIGVYGAGAGALTAAMLGINKEYGETVERTVNGKTKKIKTTDLNRILAAQETFDILIDNKAKQIKNKKSQLDYLKESLKMLKVYNPTHDLADAEGYVKFTDDVVEKIAQMLDESISDKFLAYKEWSKDSAPNSKKAIINLLTENVGAQSSCVLESTKESGLQKSVTDLERFIDDLFITSKSFNTENAKKAIEEQIKNNKTIEENAYRNAYKKFKGIKSGIGFSIAAAVGLSVQPINMYLTKKKTGSDGFVGVGGREKDKSIGFKILKTAVAFAAFAGILASLSCNMKKPKQLPKDFFKKMEFKGFWPTINQLKGIYGVTIVSRILSTRDKDELRECVTKDSLGFVSWLILGDIVNRMVAEGLDKSVLNRTKDVAEKGFFKRVFNSKLKTRDEVIINALAGKVPTTKEEGGKIVALRFKELLKKVDELAPEAKNKVIKQLRTLNGAQAAGYLFSGLVLGLGIPNLNIWITNSLDKKRKAKAEEAQKIQSTVTQA